MPLFNLKVDIFFYPFICHNFSVLLITKNLQALNIIQML